MLIDRNWRYHTNNRVSSLDYYVFVFLNHPEVLYLGLCTNCGFTSSTWPWKHGEDDTPTSLQIVVTICQDATCIILAHLKSAYLQTPLTWRLCFFNHAVSGWWFWTLFIFHIFGRIIPTDFLFFRGVETTNQVQSNMFNLVVSNMFHVQQKKHMISSDIYYCSEEVTPPHWVCGIVIGNRQSVP